MPSYRRNYHGEYFFLTVVTASRRPLFEDEANRNILSIALRKTLAERPFEITAIVLLPDHLHMIWRMPEDDSDYSTRLSIIKDRFTRSYLAAGGTEASVSPGKRMKRHRGVWQPKFWEHTIKDARDFHMHVDYVHLNPVKHGWVKSPRDWPWSSFHRYVRCGWHESDWHGRVDLRENVEYFIPE
ncbi:MAG: REP-associated tyrosine transposase [Planctomycetota bacterium]